MFIHRGVCLSVNRCMLLTQLFGVHRLLFLVYIVYRFVVHCLLFGFHWCIYMVECLDLLKIIILLYSNLYISLINTNQFILNRKAVLVVNSRSKLYILYSGYFYIHSSGSYFLHTSRYAHSFYKKVTQSSLIVLLF